jgi:hypothetical protein
MADANDQDEDAVVADAADDAVATDPVFAVLPELIAGRRRRGLP